MSKKPTTVRFSDKEEELLDELAKQSGLPVAEVIRRSVRLFAIESKSPDRLATMLMELSEHRFEEAMQSVQKKPTKTHPPNVTPLKYPTADEGLKAAEDGPPPQKAQGKRRAGK